MDSNSKFKGHKGNIAFLPKKSAKLTRQRRPPKQFQANLQSLITRSQSQSQNQPNSQEMRVTGYSNTVEMEPVDEEEKRREEDEFDESHNIRLRRARTTRFQ